MFLAGRREADVRNRFSLPTGLQLENLLQARQDIAHFTATAATAANSNQSDALPESGLAEYFVSQIDSSLTWDSIKWLRSITSLPIIIKGILTAEDAELAVLHGFVASF